MDENATATGTDVGIEKSNVSYKFGNNGRAICFVDLTDDGLSIQFHGEKEQTSIHVPAEELVDFTEWLNKRLGLPIWQLNPDFINTVWRISHKIGGSYTYRVGDKAKLKKGLKAIELAREKNG